jgi:hypothetical protein
MLYLLFISEFYKKNHQSGATSKKTTSKNRKSRKEKKDGKPKHSWTEKQKTKTLTDGKEKNEISKPEILADGKQNKDVGVDGKRSKKRLRGVQDSYLVARIVQYPYGIFVKIVPLVLTRSPCYITQP